VSCRVVTSSATTEAFVVPPMRWCVEKVFWFYHKIIKLWLIVLWSPGTYGLREFRQGMVVQGKLHCYLIVFLGWVFICWYFLRFKANLSSWESLYLIGLNPNHSKVWILVSYLFTSCTFNTWGCTLSCNFTHYRY